MSYNQVSKNNDSELKSIKKGVIFENKEIVDKEISIKQTNNKED